MSPAKPSSYPPGNVENPGALLPEERTDEHFIERHATFLRQRKEKTVQLLFLGDSITRRWVDHLHLWNYYFGHYQPANFGVGGDAAQNLLWRVQNGELDYIQPKVVALLIGTNNVPTHSGSEIAATICAIVTSIRMRLPRSKIILMAIFPRGPQKQSKPDESNPYYMDVINAANEILSGLHDQESIHFMDLGSSFLGPDGEIDIALLPDQLHLIEPGYKIWGESLKDILEKMMISN